MKVDFIYEQLKNMNKIAKKNVVKCADNETVKRRRKLVLVSSVFKRV